MGIRDFTKYENVTGWRKISINSWLTELSIKYAEKKAVSDAEMSLSFRELHVKVVGMANALHKLGLKKEDKVIIQMSNSVRFVLSLFSVIKVGAIPILVLPAHRENEINGVINTTHPSFYIVDKEYMGYNYLQMVEKFREENLCIKNIIVNGCVNKNKYIVFDELSTEETTDNFEDVDPYEIALILLSGGTTGVPKLIARTHADYLFNAYCAAERCELNVETVYTLALPASHHFPLCCPGLLGTLYFGGHTVMCAFPAADEILDAISENRATITAVVPSIAKICADMLEWDDEINISSLKLMQIGGAMLDMNLAKRLQELLPGKLNQVYGSSEGVICITRPDDTDEIIVNCQGSPISVADEIIFIDDDGNVNDSEGHLAARGPYIIERYYNQSETFADSFNKDGYYLTGDKAMRTVEGNIKIIGRVKEQINRGGEKIIPSEVEEYLYRNEKIADVAVVGVPDEIVGNRIVAVIIPKYDKVEIEEVNEFLKEQGLAQFKLPDQVLCLDSFPLTAVGKKDKKKILDIINKI